MLPRDTRTQAEIRDAQALADVDAAIRADAEYAQALADVEAQRLADEANVVEDAARQDLTPPADELKR